jgi:tetratricopeptide (TPR) repeat protein
LHNFVRARELIEKCTRMMRAAAGELLISSLDIQVQFWNALTAARMVWTLERHNKDNNSRSRENERKKKKLLLSAKKSLAKLQLLSRHSPENLNGKVFMVEAELKALDGNIDQAVVLFQKAMDHAEENDLISDRALICEQAGLTLRFCGKEDQALDYLEDCCAFYRQWGALIKVNHVKGFVIPQAIYAWEE